MVTFEQIRRNPDIKIYLEKCNEVLGVLGYTEHSLAHAGKVANDAGNILRALGYPERIIELAHIAGYIHDIGNMINRHDHAQSGGILVFQILTGLGMDPVEIATVAGAVANHDEGTGGAVSAVSAALILADKCDVRRTRVRNKDFMMQDIHDRVNFAVTDSKIVINDEKKTISLELQVDSEICDLMDYFEIFLNRMLMCKRAADFLGYAFRLVMNGTKMA